MLHETTPLPGLIVLVPKVIQDHRGYFSEVYRKDALEKCGVDVNFVQDNQSLSRYANVVRGLHFQTPPCAQDKLIRTLRGRILDVAVDIRRNSPTFGRHFAIELSAKNMKQLFIPKGFAHGFVTLENEVEVSYKTSSYYAPEHDAGIFWADPALAIPWGIRIGDAVLSVKDAQLPTLSKFETPFTYSI